eukprot:COSAG05_NODE_1678_length_4291_cov_649.414122_3_plen_81_part_00
MIAAANAVGGLSSSICEVSNEEIEELVGQREQHRANKDWASADRVRDDLRARGVDVFDKERTWKTTDGRQGRIGIGGGVA